MADILNQNGLSTGQFNTNSAPSGRLYVSPQKDNPSESIPKAQESLTSVGSWHYPSDLPKYYMGFGIYRYARDSLMAVATNELLRVVALPFPDQMLDVNQVAFDQVSFSATMGNIADASIKSVQQAVAANSMSQVADAASGGAKDILKSANNILGGLGVDATVGATGGLGKAIAGAAGYSPNYFLTVILDGPRYKTYTCSWTMAPRDAKEAADLTQIIRVFKDAQAPGLALGGALFSFPRVFQNFYMPNQGHLYQFKPSVLVNFTVNYSAGGMPSMKQAHEATGNWNAPTALRISATFLELEFWLRGDFGDVGASASPNQERSNAMRPEPGDRKAK